MPAIVNDFCVSCVDDYCTASVLPAYTAVCPVMDEHGFEEVFLTDQAHPVTADPSLIGSWSTRLSNTSDGTGTGSNVANPIRRITINDGVQAAATLNYKKSLDGKQSRLTKSTRSITWTEDDNSAERYAMWRGYQCNGAVKFYPKAGKYLYGAETGAGNGKGIDGIVKPVFAVDPTATEGGASRWTITLEWDAKCEAPRIISPI